MNSVPPDETASPRAVVAGHGDFAAGVVSAVAQISGRGDALATVSNSGLGPDEIERQLRERLAELGATVIFTDLPAGSCTIAARRLQRERPELVVVTGANVAALLDFVLHAPVAPHEAARQAVDRGRAALALAGAPRAG